MANPYAKIITIPTLETEGAWVDLTEVGARAKVTRIGGIRNTEYMKAMSDLAAGIEDLDALSTEEDTALMNKLYSEVLVKDWEVLGEDEEWVKGIYVLTEDEEDATLEEATPENIAKVITRFPEIKVALFLAAKDIASFQSKKVEEIAKN